MLPLLQLQRAAATWDGALASVTGGSARLTAVLANT